MSKPKTEANVYCIVQDNFVWHGKRHRINETLEITPRNAAEQKKLALHLEKGWLRVATPEDRQNALKLLGEATAPVPSASAPVPATAAATPGQVQMVALDKIRPDPTQPRKTFAPEAMAELVQSIRDKGVQQAIQLRPMSLWRQVVSCVARMWVRRERGDDPATWQIIAPNFWHDGIKVTAGEMMAGGAYFERLKAEYRIMPSAGNPALFVPNVAALDPVRGEKTMAGEADWLEIVYGERRWRGSEELGVATIPAKVSELTDIEAAELQAIENLKRADLLPLEDAAQYRKLMDTPGYGLQRLMEVTGKAKNTIYGKLKLLELPPDAQKAVQDGRLGASTAERLGRLTGETQQKAVKAILNPGRSWDATDAGVLKDNAARNVIEQIQREEAREQARAAMRDAAKARRLIWLEPESKPYKAVFGTSYYPLTESGLIELAQVIAGDAEQRSYNTVLSKKPFKAVAKQIQPTTATLRNDALVELYEADLVREALKQAGLELTNRKVPANTDEAIRRRRDKRMKQVLGTAALVIHAKAQALTPRIAQNAETELLWRVLAHGAAGAMGNDDLRAFVKRHDLPLARHKPYNKGEQGSPDFSATVEQHIAGQPTSALAGIVAELLLTRGAWWSQNTDFSRAFRRYAAVFGVDLRQLKIQAGASEEEVKEEEAANRKFNDEEDEESGSADVRTGDGEGDLEDAA